MCHDLTGRKFKLKKLKIYKTLYKITQNNKIHSFILKSRILIAIMDDLEIRGFLPSTF